MKRLTARLALVFALFPALAYGLDWGIWRMVHGAATGVVRVTREVVAPLKGGREEYYFDGTSDETCSRSWLPEGGMRACWWVERHRVVFDR